MAGSGTAALAVLCCTRAALADPAYAVQRLNDLGVGASGSQITHAYGINVVGDVVGSSIANGNQSGQPVVWPAGSTAAVPLQVVPTTGAPVGAAMSINNSGVVVGAQSGLSPFGDRPLYWPSVTSAPVQVPTLSSTDDAGIARAVNAAGEFVGDSDKVSLSNPPYLGYRAVRWTAGGASIAELANLGTTTAGYTLSTAMSINDHGDAVGYAEKYSANTDIGMKAVRWNAGDTAATELPTPSGPTSTFNSQAYGVNNHGEAVGYARDGIRQFALRWSPDGTSFTELGSLGTTSLGAMSASAQAIDSAGDIVGSSDKYVGDTLIGAHGVLWSAGSNNAVDLNDITSLPAGWTIESANGIGDAGIILASVSFDPDGSGPLAVEHFPVRLTPTPEPGATCLLLVASPLMLGWRRRRSQPTSGI